METEKDKELWKLAKKRVGFKRHLAIYLVVNLMLWGMWFMGAKDEEDNFPWPIWSSFGWGIGILFDYIGAYGAPKISATEREYEKLKNKNN